MTAFYIILGVACFLLVAALVTTLVCFFMVFYSPTRKPKREGDYEIPDGKEYEPFRERMINWQKQIEQMPHTVHTVKSHDGLKLVGKFYECSPDSPIELMFHGYKGSADRDLCGGVERCFRLGHSAFIVNQRASAASEGHIITFGAKERLDCLTWLDYLTKNISATRPIILTGISMGAATVMLASELQLPDNVVGVLADCGYTSAEDIIKKIVREMHLPPSLFYPFIRLSARLFGGFDLQLASPERAVRYARVPIIFFHGDSDGFVPCEMSEINYHACRTRKAIYIVKGADHGLAYPVDKEGYLNAMREFYNKNTMICK